jgi:hypothetical protein
MLGMPLSAVQIINELVDAGKINRIVNFPKQMVMRDKHVDVYHFKSVSVAFFPVHTP